MGNHITVIILSAREHVSEKVAAILTEAAGIHVVAVTANLSDLEPLCQQLNSCILVVCAVSSPPNREVIAKLAARECPSLLGTVILESVTGPEWDLSALVPLVKRIAARPNLNGPPAAYSL